MFKKAKPIFLKELNREMNVSAMFSAEFDWDAESALLHITGATYYRIYVNKKFAGYGPARAAKGYTVMDEIDISKYLEKGKNKIEIEVSSYNCRTFACMNYPGFVQAEVLCGKNVLAATGYDFEGFRNLERVQKTMRYSYQRGFSEVYKQKEQRWEKFPVETLEHNLTIKSRITPYPAYEIVYPVRAAYKGVTEYKNTEIPEKRFINNIGPDASDGFHLEEISDRPVYDLIQSDYLVDNEKDEHSFPYNLKKGEYIVFDMGKNTTGFIRQKLKCLSNARVLIGFNEHDKQGKFFSFENSITNVISYELKVGEHETEAFEISEFKYVFVFVREGEIELENIAVREYVNPLQNVPTLNTENQVLKDIYKAAVETFRQNALDVFMDCPGRERAGWLMDAVFTARAEHFITGKTIVNQAMIDNFVEATDFDGVPDGLIPMCYPSEMIAGEYIPQFCMGYGIQVYEHIKRSGQSPAKYKKLLYGIYNWMKKHENSDGLAEKLEGWNFVEWSKCNDWTQDVNYPTNMLYSYFMKLLSEMYGDKDLEEKSRNLKDKIIGKAFNGEYFVDNAVYTENGLENTTNVSETCQYYAVFTGVADLNDDKFSKLKTHILKTFGPEGTHDFVPYEQSNFIYGIYWRMDCLLKLGETELLLREIERYFKHMAYLSGTIWEHTIDSNSLNHGFASWLSEVIYKCVNK